MSSAAVQHSTPTTTGMTASTYAQFYPEAPSSPVSARISQTHSQYQPSPTQQQAQSDTRPQSNRVAAYTTRDYPSRSPTAPAHHPYMNQAEPERPQSQRSHREHQTSGSQSERTRYAPVTSRPTTAVGQAPVETELSRENSTVINRIVVDEPETDIVREEIRQTNAKPHIPTTQMATMSLQETANPVPVQRSRQEHLKHAQPHRKDVKFGDYYLGQTIGEGEFGKVKLGWKKDSDTQVAIKFIKKDQAGTNNRLPKIRREISILRELQHPNIVRLHEFIETERHMGIILEYASGGELFDYILNHRYLKDNAAKRLFAELISGVGYLHQNGIVHRDLKLENLLLDRHKHIIITDFGFANTFDPHDELGAEMEGRVSDKDFVKSQGLDKLRRTPSGRDLGWRRGDLMQTSCGSPCYAAPELVVQDGLYCGRKVDVWSCGVILYAMLAGYLPWDDDPANPDGDNINLLYKYISNTPITFPEYVTPHSRDLLRRILQHKPENRADMFEVVRHSWLSEYSHVVCFIGSTVVPKSPTTASAPQHKERPPIGRSASVREPSSRSPAPERASIYNPQQGSLAAIDGDESRDMGYKQRDTKRNTVQIEYKTPQAYTARSERNREGSGQPQAGSAYPPRSMSQGQTHAVMNDTTRREKEASAMGTTDNRATSENVSAFGSAVATSRPNTSGTFNGAHARLPSRGNSYSQPAAAQPTNTNAQGSFSQPPKSGSGYIMTSPASGEANVVVEPAAVRPSHEPSRIGSGQFPVPQQPYSQSKPSRHRRSSTLGSITDKMLNRSSSKRTSQQENGAGSNEKRDRRYPPISMKNTLTAAGDDNLVRPSTDSRRPSFGFARKPSKERDSSIQGRRSSRRFSWMPTSLSAVSFSGKKEQGYESGDDGYRPPRAQQSQSPRTGRPQSNDMAFGRGRSETPSDETTNSAIPLYYDDDRERARTAARQQRYQAHDQRNRQTSHDKTMPSSPGVAQGSGGQPVMVALSPTVRHKQYRDDGHGSDALDSSQGPEPVERFYTPAQEPEVASTSSPGPPDQYNLNGQGEWRQRESSVRQTSLRPPHRKFGYDDHGHGGSSSAAKKVMNFFRRRKDSEA